MTEITRIIEEDSITEEDLIIEEVLVIIEIISIKIEITIKITIKIESKQIQTSIKIQHSNLIKITTIKINTRTLETIAAKMDIEIIIEIIKTTITVGKIETIIREMSPIGNK